MGKKKKAHPQSAIVPIEEVRKKSVVYALEDAARAGIKIRRRRLTLGMSLDGSDPLDDADKK